MDRQSRHEPRSDGHLLEIMARRVVQYRLAIIAAMNELSPRACASCMRAEHILLDTDNSAPDPDTPPPVPWMSRRPPEPRKPT